MVQKGCIWAQLEGPGGIVFMISHFGRFQNYASRRGRRAFFTKNMQISEGEGVQSDKKTKKAVDGIRNS